MSVQRKLYSAEMNVKVALEAIKGKRTANEIVSDYGVHPSQIAQWKKQAMEEMPQVFGGKGAERGKKDEALIATLYQQIV